MTSDRRPVPEVHAVAWGDLSHHYGSAEDLPGLLSRARSRDLDEARGALADLDNALFHQGGLIPSAAPPALPFLVALASDRELALEARVDAIGIVARLASVPSSGSRHIDPGWAYAWAEAAGALTQLAGDADSSVRAAMVEVLAESALDEHAEVLLERRRVEQDGPTLLDVLVAVGSAAGLSASPEVVDRCGLALDESLQSTDAMIRFAALLGRVVLEPGAALRRSDVVIDAVRAPEVPNRFWSTWGGAPEVRLRRGSELFASDPVARTDLLLRLSVLDLDVGTRSALVGEVAATAIPHPGVWPRLSPIVGAAIGDPSPKGRRRGLHLVAAMGPIAATHADACAALVDDTGPTRFDGTEGNEGSVALWALVRLGDPRAVDALLRRIGLPCFGFADHGIFHGSDPRSFSLPSAHEVLAQIPSPPPSLVSAVGERLARADTLAERRTLCQVAEEWGPLAAPLDAALVRLVSDPKVGDFAAKALIALGPISEPARRRLRRASPPDPTLAAWLRSTCLGDDGPARRILPSEHIDRGSMDLLRMIADLSIDLPEVSVRALEEAAASADEWVAILAGYALSRRLGPSPERLASHVRALRRLGKRQCVPVMLVALEHLLELEVTIPEVDDLVLRAVQADWRIAYFGGWRTCVEDENFRTAADLYLTLH